MQLSYHILWNVIPSLLLFIHIFAFFLKFRFRIISLNFIICLGASSWGLGGMLNGKCNSFSTKCWYSRLFNVLCTKKLKQKIHLVNNDSWTWKCVALEPGVQGVLTIYWLMKDDKKHYCWYHMCVLFPSCYQNSTAW